MRAALIELLQGRVATASQLADDLGEPVSRVGYHIAFLRELGCVEVVRTGRARGAIEHFYRASIPARPDEAPAARA